MISVNNITLQYGKRVLFDNVNLKFEGERCYGVIGANGAGKSTFLKILNSEIEPNYGNVSIEKDKRISVLKQNHFKYDEISLLETVMMGHQEYGCHSRKIWLFKAALMKMMGLKLQN